MLDYRRKGFLKHPSRSKNQEAPMMLHVLFDMSAVYDTPATGGARFK